MALSLALSPPCALCGWPENSLHLERNGKNIKLFRTVRTQACVLMNTMVERMCLSVCAYECGLQVVAANTGISFAVSRIWPIQPFCHQC